MYIVESELKLTILYVNGVRPHFCLIMSRLILNTCSTTKCESHDLRVIPSSSHLTGIFLQFFVLPSVTLFCVVSILNDTNKVGRQKPAANVCNLNNLVTKVVS